MDSKKTPNSLEDGLIDLYLYLKIRKEEDVFFKIFIQKLKKYSEEDYKNEKNSLKTQSPFLILKYIRATVDILINIRQEEEKRTRLKSASSSNENYEEMLQKAESEVRYHVSVFLPLFYKRINKD